MSVRRMWNKRKRLVALTAIAGFLAVPAPDSFAQSISPFGKGNPIQSLSEQLDRLEGRVGNLEISQVPTSLSGRYESTMIGSCLDTKPGASWNFYTNILLETLRFYADGRIEGTEDYKLLTVGPTTTKLKKTRAPDCAYRYAMTSPGTFTWISNEGTTECPNDPSSLNPNPWKGGYKLQGRIFDGGKTLTLRSEEFNEEAFGGSDLERVGYTRKCTRTNTLRKISN